MNAATGRRGGFTLVELLVVIAIIGILVALLLPAVQAAREASRRTECANHLKQIGVAMHNYHDTHKRLPYGSPGCCTLPGGTWPALLLPFIERQSLYDQIDFNKTPKDPVNAQAVAQVIPTYICPSDGVSRGPVFTDRYGHNPTTAMGLWYPASMGPTIPDACPFCPDPNPSPSNWCCQGVNFATPDGEFAGMFGRHRRTLRLAEVTDGLSNTIMNGETIPGHCVFMCAHCTNFNVAPTTIPINTMESNTAGLYWYRTCGFKSMHPGIAQFVFGDGSVHPLSETIDFRVFNLYGDRRDNQVVPRP